MKKLHIHRYSLTLHELVARFAEFLSMNLFFFFFLAGRKKVANYRTGESNLTQSYKLGQESSTKEM